MAVSGFFCTFVEYLRYINNPNYSPFKTSKVMNKTVKKVLQVISYIISLLLGAGKGEKVKNKQVKR